MQLFAFQSISEVHLIECLWVFFLGFFALTGQLNQYCCQATRVTQESVLSQIFICCDFFTAPHFLFPPVSVFPELFTGSGGTGFQITLRSAAFPNFFLQLPPATRMQFFRSRKTAVFVRVMSCHPRPRGGSRPLC